MSKKIKRKVGIEGMSFRDALEKLVRASPKEILLEMEKTKVDIEEVERRVERTEDSVGRGARRTKHRFRI